MRATFVLLCLASSIISAEAAVFNVDTWITPTNTIYEGESIVVSGCKLTVDGTHAFSGVSVTNGGVLTHSLGDRMELSVTGDVFIGADSRVDVSQKGYPAGQGPGKGGSWYGIGAAGHGGAGGKENSRPGGVAYGSLTDPTAAGSGAGGAGGGVLRWVVTGELKLEGSLLANGANGFDVWPDSSYGGASGGSIYLRAGTFNGSGLVSVNGGKAIGSGGGAGGRIAVYFTTSNYQGSWQAYAGDGTQRGGAGTIYLKGEFETAPRILMNGGGTAVGAATEVSGVSELPSLAVLGGANVTFPDLAKVNSDVLVSNSIALISVPLQINGSAIITNGTLRVAGSTEVTGNFIVGGAGAVGAVKGTNTIAGDVKILEGATGELSGTNWVGGALSLLSGSALTHQAGYTQGLALKVTGKMLVDAGSRVDVSKKGYPANQGPGIGTEYYGRGGAGHGGKGGTVPSRNGGPAYGSLADPITAGSGSSGSAAGGGVVRLWTDDLELQGSLLANGGDGGDVWGGPSHGGGSGGSINLRITRLMGAGLVSANGGNAQGTGGGAGGRIAIYYADSTFNGLIRAYGGAGGERGGAGTVYIKGETDTLARLVMDGGGTTVGAATEVSGVVELPSLAVLGGANVTFPDLAKVNSDVLVSNSTALINVPLQINGSAIITNGTLRVAGSTEVIRDFIVGGAGAVGAVKGTNNIAGDVKILEGATGELSGTNWIGGALSVLSGSVLTHQAGYLQGMALKVTGKMLVDSGSRLDVSKKGYPADQGPGIGTEWYGRAGAGHGGKGGSVTGRTGGAAYGSLTDPITAGSGSSGPAAGGGVVRLWTDDLELQGSLLANGGDGGDVWGGPVHGGGSGGSINLRIARLSGGGSVSAKGGNAQSSGGGAGGRIAIYYADSTFDGPIRAYGGAGGERGGAGTVYVKGETDALPRLVMDGGGTVVGADTPVSELTELPSLVVCGGANVTFLDLAKVNSGVVISNASATFNAPIVFHGNVVVTNAACRAKASGEVFGDLLVDGAGSVLGLTGTNRVSGNLYVGYGATGELNGTNWIGGSVSVLGGSILTHQAGGNQGLILTVNSKMVLDAASRIDVTKKGYPPNQGPGIGTEWYGRGGAGHGGGGGSVPSRAGGPAYGSVTDPITAGSGSSGYAAGGGVVRIWAKELELQGNVTANGGDGGDQWQQVHGGGSGGSINLRAATLSGTGLLSVNGGNSITGGGGGSGGRIAVYYKDSTFTGPLQAYGGIGAERGGAGTVYTKGELEPYPRLVMDAGAETIVPVTPISGVSQVTGLWVGRGAHVIFQDLVKAVGNVLVTNGTAGFVLPVEFGGDLTFGGAGTQGELNGNNQISGSLNLLAGAILSHAAGNTQGVTLNILGDLLVATGCRVDVSGRGYGGGKGGGPGGGGEYNNLGSGAGYGGRGGKTSGVGGGSSYGSISEPIHVGSCARGNNRGGSGGGAVRLVVAGKAQLEGDVLADGADGGAPWGGGGSGGTVYIRAAEVLGSGTVSANGGSGAGGGGGGRIAAYYTTSTYTGLMRSYGGSGYERGGVGTIYLKADQDSLPTILLNGAGAGLGATTPVAGLPTVPSLSISGGANILFEDLTNVVGGVALGNGTFRFGNLGHVGGAVTLTNAAVLLEAEAVLEGDLVVSGTNAVLELNETNQVGGNVQFLEGSTLTHTSGQTNGLLLQVSHNLYVDADSKVDASARGYGPKTGPGKGGYSLGQGAAGYGGRGGNGAAVGGGIYGSMADPVHVGSGGGGAGSSGGGAIRLSVGGNLQLEGRVLVNGGNGVKDGYDNGGGSGGSINIHANSFSGTGSMSAIGGSASDITKQGGGGGGRIAVQCNTGSFAGQATVVGGNGVLAGGLGTLFWNGVMGFRDLVLNKQYIERLERDAPAHNWTFTGVKGQQVRLNGVKASSAGVQFNLLGPGGWIGFQGQAADSGLVNLPASGDYMLVARNAGGAQALDYSFRLEETPQIWLPLGITFTGTFLGNEQAQLFRLGVTNLSSFRITLKNAGTGNQAQLYLCYNDKPTRGVFDYQASTPGVANQTLLVGNPYQGEWSLLVYGDLISSPGQYTLQVETNIVAIAEVNPMTWGNTVPLDLRIKGAGMAVDSKVSLLGTGGREFRADKVVVVSPWQLKASFAANTIPAGTYTVKLASSAGSQDTLPNGLRMLQANWPKLDINFIHPNWVGRHALATFYVEYGNSGSMPMAAPLLVLKSGDPDRLDQPIMTMNSQLVTRGLWTPNMPAGFGSSVQFMGHGSSQGVLAPGEVRRIPVYYSGLQQPWDFSKTEVTFTLAAYGNNQRKPIPWDDLKTELRPTWINAEAWEAVYGNLRKQVGGTWQDYNNALNTTAAYLGTLGQQESKSSRLWLDQILKANGFGPVPVIESASDLVVSGPGLSVGVSRAFGTTIAERYSTGIFGRGWRSPWDARLRVLPSGTVEIPGVGQSTQRFDPDTRKAGVGFFSPVGDSSILERLPDGSFRLQQPNGITTAYLADGNFAYIQDSNGNRVTAAYEGNRLKTLTHSSGQWVSFTYTAQGRVQALTDSAGRKANYSYDSAEEHLTEVQNTHRLTTRYSYSPDPNPVLRHALTSVTHPDGRVSSFEYDHAGRVSSVYRNGGAERRSFTYEDATGAIAMDDGRGGISRRFYDARGAIARSEGALGDTVMHMFDQDHRVVGTTDSSGRSYAYTYACCGLVTSQTDANGQVERFTYGNSPRRRISSSDARNVTTQYGYDAKGNLATISYPDRRQVTFGYDSQGSLISYTNRRQESFLFRRDSEGRVTSGTSPSGEALAYSYDSHGNLLSVSNAQGVIAFVYDEADRRTRVTYPNGRYLAYTYDTVGRRTSISDATGLLVRYAYDAAGRLSRVSNGAGALVAAYSYNVAGDLVREDHGNGTFSTCAYNAEGWPTEIVHHAPGGGVNAKFAYVYDSAGRITRMTTLDGEWTYEHDRNNQLTRAIFISVNPAIPGQDLRYEYDAAGNRIRSIENGATTDYGANLLNQYPTIGEASLSYDLEGNLLAWSNSAKTNSYSYDSENHLISVTTSEGVWQYEYDALGHRSAVVHEGRRREYLVDPIRGGTPVSEFEQNGQRSALYLYGLGLVCRSGAGLELYYDSDIVGSICGISGAAGDYLNAYAYKPFGEVIGEVETVPNIFKFVGALGVTDEGTGLLFMKARSYDPVQGRFVMEDPLGMGGSDLNLYRYCHNAPLSSEDSLGLVETGDTQCNLVDDGNGKKVWRAKVTYTTTFEDGGGTVTLDWSDDPCLRKHEEVHVRQCKKGNWPTTRKQCNLSEYIAHEIQLECVRRGGDDVGFIKVLLRRNEAIEGKYPPCKNYPDIESPTMPEPILIPDQILEEMQYAFSSGDPNSKTGPSGYSAAGFISSTTPFPYRIDFENEPSATAPAQQVVVVDTLSTNLDLTTFTVTEVGFGDVFVPVPPNQQHFETNLIFNCCGIDLQVQIEVGLRPYSGEMYAQFFSIDPSTGLPPPVDMGFLHPEDGTGRGQGHVSFLVKPKANLPTGTEIRNIARISFDNQPWIFTNQRDPHNPAAGTDPAKECLNTIDGVAPVSRVQSLPSESGRSFVLRWSGSDDPSGSGLSSYTLYISTNGAPFFPWLEDTTDTAMIYRGELGKTYRFSCTARDNVGNEEILHATADATTTVSLNSPLLAQVPDQALEVDTPFNLPLKVTQAVPSTYQFLLWDAPAGLGVDAASGTLSWTPICDQGGTSNALTLWVTDLKHTNLSDAVSFHLSVAPCTQGGEMNTWIIPAGERGRLPVLLSTSEPLSTQWVRLELPVSRLVDPSVEVHPSATNMVGSARIEASSNSLYLISFAAQGNYPMQGTQQVAWLHVTAPAGQSSAFVNVRLMEPQGLGPNGNLVVAGGDQDMRVVVLGEEPLLQAQLKASNERSVVLYSRLGTTNTIEMTGDLRLAASWTSHSQVVMTNLFQVIRTPGLLSDPLFIRAQRR